MYQKKQIAKKKMKKKENENIEKVILRVLNMAGELKRECIRLSEMFGCKVTLNKFLLVDNQESAYAAIKSFIMKIGNDRAKNKSIAHLIMALEHMKWIDETSNKKSIINIIINGFGIDCSYSGVLNHYSKINDRNKTQVQKIIDYLNLQMDSQDI